MAREKHSYVPFYLDAWAGGTARMPRLMKSIYFDVCFYNWDKGAPMPLSEQRMAFSDLPQADAENIIEVLVEAEKLDRYEDGSLSSPRAIEEAEKAINLYRAKSSGGKNAAAKTNAKRPKSKTPVESAPENREEENRIEEERGFAPLSSDDDEAAPVDPVVDVETPAAGEESEEGEKPAKPKPPAKPEPTPADVISIWNDMASAHGLASVKMLTAARLTKMRTRIKECGAEAIVEAIGLIPKRSWCMDPANRRYVTIDWLCYPNTVPRLIEGAMYQGGGDDGSWSNA